jgi:sugar phosphate permease
MTMETDEAGAGEWRRGWRGLTSATIGVGVGYNLFLMTAGLFIIPMEQEWHVPRSALALAPVAGSLSALLTPVAGVAIDRIGPRPLAILGLVALGLAYVAMAFLPSNLMLLYAMALVFALVTPFSNPMIFCRGMATWFRRHTGVAMGITMSGVSAGATIALPLLAWIIAGHGWRAGYAALAGVVLLVGLPMILLWFHERPEADGGRPPLTPVDSWPLLRRLARDRRFWIINIAFGLAGIFIGGFMNQLQPVLIGRGFSALSAAGIVSVYTAAIGCGRIGAGWWLDRWKPQWVAMCCLLAAACGALMIAGIDGTTDGAWLLAALAAAMIGLGQGAEATSSPSSRSACSASAPSPRSLACSR